MSWGVFVFFILFTVNTIVTWIFVTNAGCKLPGHLGISCPDSSPPPPPPATTNTVGDTGTTSTYTSYSYHRR